MNLTIEATSTAYTPSKLIIQDEEFSDYRITIDNGIGNAETILLKKKHLRNLKDYITIILKD